MNEWERETEWAWDSDEEREIMSNLEILSVLVRMGVKEQVSIVIDKE